MRTFFASLIEVAEIAVVAIGAVYLIRTFLVQPFLVSGASMAPNFSNGDYLLIDELTYRLRNPVRGETVVFHYPKDESTYFIKRVIGVPGDHVRVSEGHVVLTSADHPEGTVLREPYLTSAVVTNTRPGTPTDFVLGATEYFVLGDNRSYSFDSRDWGLLTRKEIVGLVRLRLWPFAGVTVFAAPQY